MKAMILKQPGPVTGSPLELTNLPTPKPGPDDIRIRVNVCGVCHTDLHTVEGELETKKSPLIPGHQIVGTVESMGSRVTQYNVGDRAGACWLNSACGRCEQCTQGRENLCGSARFTGYHTNGGYAEYAVIPADYALPIPKGFPDRAAAPLLCAGIIGYRSLRLSEIKPGQSLGLYGFGASAHITIQVARYWGCRVSVFTRGEEHRNHAMSLGAEWAGGAEETPPELMNSSIIFAPAGTLVPLALSSLKKGGTLAINAIHMSPIPEIPYSRLYHERTIRSVANCTREDGKQLLELAAKIPIKTDVETFPLSEANEVLRRLKRSEIRGAAVLVCGD